MAKISFLNFQNSFSKKAPTPEPTLLHHAKSKELIQKPSMEISTFQPNTKELRNIFNKFDTNGDGKISLEEYKQALKILGGVTRKNEAAAAAAQSFAAADTDGDGFIDFEEFIKVHVTDGGVKNEEIEAAFRVFDRDGDGKISAVELMEVLKRMGEKYNLEACKKMIRGIDRDGDGLIDMDEFRNMMQAKETMKIM